MAAPVYCEDLRAKVQLLLAEREKIQCMRRAARDEYEQKHSARINYQILLDIYEQAACARTGRTAVTRWLRRLAAAENPASVGARFRRRRFEHFRALVTPLPRPLRILDVGGYFEFWMVAGYADEPGIEIVVLNLPDQLTTPAVGQRNLHAMAGDARELPELGDGAFDIVFSNSVIEHVGTLADQRRMAGEVRRVGKRYYVQTPNRNFPIEPHFLFPFFQFLPLEAQVTLVQRFALGHHDRHPDPAEARRVVSSVRLLTGDEMRRLFPGARLYEERVAGLTKSFVAYAGWP